jgi:hypothetical protein
MTPNLIPPPEYFDRLLRISLRADIRAQYTNLAFKSRAERRLSTPRSDAWSGYWTGLAG